MSDILAAFLYGQLEKFEEIFVKRNEIWKRDKEGLSQLAESKGVAIPEYSAEVEHTGHLFFLRFNSKNIRDNFIHYMRENRIQPPFHYQALHQTPYAKPFDPSSCPNSNIASDTLVRLPFIILWKKKHNFM